MENSISKNPRGKLFLLTKVKNVSVKRAKKNNLLMDSRREVSKMTINENCPCKRKKCERHGKCDECRKHHAESKRQRPVACEKEKKR